MPLAYYEVQDIEPVGIPVHPDDSGLLAGSTDIAAKGGIGFGCSLGIEALLETRETVWKGGVDLTAGPLGREVQVVKNQLLSPPISNYRQQEADVRPTSQGSFVYDKIIPRIPGVRPFVGVERGVGKWALSAEIGFPYARWKREWGHHRFNKEERTGSRADSVWGVRPAIGLINKSQGMGMELAYEEQQTDFGRITAKSVYFVLEIP